MCITTNKFCFITTVSILAGDSLNCEKVSKSLRRQQIWIGQAFKKIHTFTCVYIFLADYFP